MTCFGRHVTSLQVGAPRFARVPRVFSSGVFGKKRFEAGLCCRGLDSRNPARKRCWEVLRTRWTDRESWKLSKNSGQIMSFWHTTEIAKEIVIGSCGLTLKERQTSGSLTYQNESATDHERVDRCMIRSVCGVNVGRVILWLRTFEETLVRHRPIHGESNIDFLGESEGSPDSPPQD